MIARWLLCPAVAALTVCACDPSADRDRSAAPPPLQNLVLVTIDTQRADRLALYGGEVAMPNLEAMARRGAVFERAYSHAPMTGPSHASLFTSLLVAEHGLENNGQALDSRHVTLAELLRDSGRRTGAFVSLAVLWRKFGLDAGFDDYVDEPARKAWWLTADEVNELALPWIEKHRSEPFFAFVHYSDPHEPYLPPEDYQQIEVAWDGTSADPVVVDGRRTALRTVSRNGTSRLSLSLRGSTPVRVFDWKLSDGIRLELGDPSAASGGELSLEPGAPAELILHDTRPEPGELQVRFRAEPRQEPADKRRAYDLETRRVDAALGELLAIFDRHDLWASTVLVVTADHGEELGEHSGHFGHTQRLFESVIRVPLVVVARSHFEEGDRVSRLVRHIDLLPTLARLLDFPLPEQARGAPFWPTDAIGDRVAVAETYQPQAPADRVTAVGERYKLERVGDDGTLELYDLERDPEERAPEHVQSSRESPAGGAWRHLELALDGRTPPADSSRREVPLDESDLEALRALGYAE